jgi:hypothetical protein
MLIRFVETHALIEAHPAATDVLGYTTPRISRPLNQGDSARVYTLADENHGSVVTVFAVSGESQNSRG